MHKARKQTVWITRTQPSAQQTADAFERAGFRTLIAPLLTVEYETNREAIPDKSVLIFTSQNGVRAFCAGQSCRDYPVFTVGDATAQLARQMGFSVVRSAGGTSDDIAPLIAQSALKQAQYLHRPYLHISGQHVRGTVSQDLRAAGFKAERRIYYRSASVQVMPDIDVTKADIAAFFSPLAAQTLALLSPQIRHLKAASISAATDEALGTLEFKQRCIARAPTVKSLIAALGEAG